ncbi:hypothetical protein G9A89_020106 [Geosiphon pyriformis]|nr:hypothetical protein G9A89_020106 [Geosiphon pyriformis]
MTPATVKLETGTMIDGRRVKSLVTPLVKSRSMSHVRGQARKFSKGWRSRSLSRIYHPTRSDDLKILMNSTSTASGQSEKDSYSEGFESRELSISDKNQSVIVDDNSTPDLNNGVQLKEQVINSTFDQEGSSINVDEENHISIKHKERTVRFSEVEFELNQKHGTIGRFLNVRRFV